MRILAKQYVNFGSVSNLCELVKGSALVGLDVFLKGERKQISKLQ